MCYASQLVLQIICSSRITFKQNKTIKMDQSFILSCCACFELSFHLSGRIRSENMSSCPRVQRQSAMLYVDQRHLLSSGRSPPGLAKTPLSALGLKPHNPAEILLNQTGSGQCQHTCAKNGEIELLTDWLQNQINNDVLMTKKTLICFFYCF